MNYENLSEILSGKAFTKGWINFEHATTDEALLTLASQIGEIVPEDNGSLIQHLKPKVKGRGVQNSFSFNFGLGDFPYHTDTAFWSVPAQLIMMASQNESNCNTLLIDTREMIDNLTSNQLKAFHEAVFSLTTKKEIKFVSLLQREKGKSVLRYDPNIMKPFNASAEKASDIINSFINHVTPITLKWTGENVVLIDNWRFLHKRGECKNESKRLVKRIYINQL